MWARLPLRTRLTLGYSLFFALVLLLLIIGVYWLVRNALRSEIVDSLETSAALVEQEFTDSDQPLIDYFGDPEVVLQPLSAEVTDLGSPTLYAQVLTPDGVVVASSASLGTTASILPDRLRGVALRRPVQATEEIAGGRGLLLALPLRRTTRTVGVLIVARPLALVDRTLRVLLISLSTTGIVALLAAVRGGAWLARRALQPVEAIAQTAQQIVQATDLQRRIEPPSSNDEIGQLTTTVNAMLERLDSLFTAQQRFVADVSHELRTPLTAMRGQVELLRRGVITDEQEHQAALRSITHELSRLTRLTNDLLLLARSEAGFHLRHQPIVLDDLVLEVVRELRPLAEGVALVPQIDEQVALLGDRDRLKQALINLVANALQHTPAGGRVTVALAGNPTTAMVRVIDTGCGIHATDIPHVFERFYRANHETVQQVSGAGLGLAIVQRVADLHGGTIAVSSDVGVGSTFTLTLPLAPA